MQSFVDQLKSLQGLIFDKVRIELAIGHEKRSQVAVKHEGARLTLFLPLHAILTHEAVTELLQNGLQHGIIDELEAQLVLNPVNFVYVLLEKMGELDQV